MSDALKITEIFFSLQGEARTIGVPTVFVRLTGCPLRCQYCDTEYAFTGGEKMTHAEVLQAVKEYPASHVTVTGGEPLAQPGCKALLKALCDRGYQVSLETSGAMDISDIDERVSRVMDLKTPASGEQGKNKMDNISLLNSNDQVKFVICSREDYDWAAEMLTKYRLPERCEVLFSPSHDQQDATQLAQWVLEDGLPVRFQIQLHKYLWGNRPGH